MGRPGGGLLSLQSRPWVRICLARGGQPPPPPLLAARPSGAAALSSDTHVGYAV